MYSQLCEAINGVDHIELDASVSDAQCLNDSLSFLYVFSVLPENQKFNSLKNVHKSRVSFCMQLFECKHKHFQNQVDTVFHIVWLLFLLISFLFVSYVY